MNRNVMGKISLSNIAEELAVKSNLSREAATDFMHAFVETIEKGLGEDGIVKIKGLGTFKLQEMSDRGSVDVNTGERITIKGHRKVTFTPDSAMKELVNRPFAHFEPTELNEGYPEEEESPLVETDNSSDIKEEQKTEEVEVAEVESETSTEEIMAVDATTAEEAMVENTETVSEDAVMEEVNMSEKVAELEDVSIEPSEVEPEAVVSEEVQVETENTTEEDVVVEDNTASEPTEEPVESVSPAIATEDIHETPSQEAKKKRHGCLKWIFVLLLLLAVLALVFNWLVAPMPISESLRKDAVLEQDEIKVKPNLEEELGVEWTNIQKTEEQLPKNDEENVAVDSVEVKTEQQTKVEPDPIAPEFTFRITESLQAKDIKDITPADTTDYVIDGTLATHKLSRGETIIQLAKQYYGDKRLWPYIVKHNKMKDYNNVAIGQKINIPVLRNK